VALWLLLGVTPAISQQSMPTNDIVAATKTVEVSPKVQGLFLLEPSDNSYSERFVLTKSIQVTGPLVGPAKAKSFSEFVRKVGHLVNPFAAGPANAQAGTLAPVSGRAWSSMVGWSPGASAFPTEAHHDIPQLRLLSFSMEKQP
jgi:hypothetical protein